MGFFSWHTNDTGEVIWNKFAKEANDAGKAKTVYLIDNKGNKYKEDNYEGYGVFGGKDFYVLLAEMNNLDTSSEELARDAAIDLIHSNKPFISPNLVSNPKSKWKNRFPENHEGQGFWDW